MGKDDKLIGQNIFLRVTIKAVNRSIVLIMTRGQIYITLNNAAAIAPAVLQVECHPYYQQSYINLIRIFATLLN